MTIENIKKIAFEKHGKKLSDEEAAEYAEKYGKLSDDELDNVSGGCGGGSAESGVCDAGSEDNVNKIFKLC